MIRPYVPRPWLRNGHLMTVYTWWRDRPSPPLPAVETRLYQVAPDTQISADCFWQSKRDRAPAFLMLHGLEASSAAHYMLGVAGKAYARGFSVVLLNQRNCGGTEHLSPGLYHSGLTSDPVHVLDDLVSSDRIGRIVVGGYSLGGNLALKLAGDYGEAPPAALRAVCAVSPVIELSQCVDALERRSNIVYQWNFVKDLKARMRRKEAHFPGAFAYDRLPSIRTVREFDEVYTAPHFGFAHAEDYYHRASAMRVAGRIRVPTLIISARNDPFVPASMFDDPAVRGNPRITIEVTEYGGHCGFVSASSAGDDGYWAEGAIVDFAAAHV